MKTHLSFRAVFGCFIFFAFACLGLATTATTGDHDHHGSGEMESSSSDTHNHATDHGNGGESSVWLQKVSFLFGKFHVLSVHLPIGLLTFAAFFELIGWWRGGAIWSTVSRFNYVAGALAALVAAPLGWLAASQANYPSDIQDVLTWHRWLGVSTATICLLGLAALFIEYRRGMQTSLLYRILLLVTAITVPITAHFGGSLIYGRDYLFNGF